MADKRRINADEAKQVGATIGIDWATLEDLAGLVGGLVIYIEWR